MPKSTIKVGGVVVLSAALLTAGAAFISQSQAQQIVIENPKIAGWTRPSGCIIVDMPDASKVSSLQSRIDLLADRDVYALVTKRTHDDNRNVFLDKKNKNIVKTVILTTNPTDAELESQLATEFPGVCNVILHAWPK